VIALANILLRQVPAELIAGVQSGELQVLGSIVRSVSSGRIVGHLQETSLLSKVAAQAPLGLSSVIGDAVTVVQNEQIKSAVAVVQSLQMTNLMLSGASIGVSVGGAALILHKLKALESKVEALESQLAQIAKDVQALRRDRIAEDFARLSTLIEQLEESWSLTNPEAEWRDIARDAHFLADNFGRRARELQVDGSDPLLPLAFIDAFAMASATRVTARLASDDKTAAFEAAQSSAEALVELGSEIQLAPLVLRHTVPLQAELGTPAWTAQLDGEEKVLRPLVAQVRQREEAAAASALTIVCLQERGISGREWLERARAEIESPLLFLPAGEEAPPEV
jgi:hypothetical protein